MSVKEKINKLLIQLAEIKGIVNFEVFPDENVLKGDGFLGEFYTGKLENKDTGEFIETYIKFPPQDCDVNVKNLYFVNEYLYYSALYPALESFQQEKEIDNPFNNVPVFYCGSEYSIALENLIEKDYTLYDKTKFLDEPHLKAIFQLFGKYHALNFSYKDQKKEEYQNLMRKSEDLFSLLVPQVGNIIVKFFKAGYESVKEVDEEKAAKILPFTKNGNYVSTKGTNYEGKYSALTHGDCWSNNMMFKYNENGDIEDVKLLDHQVIRDSTPVHDLSYVLYSGASKESFEKLDYYLQLYYKSFCEFTRKLGSDPDILLPFDALKADWIEYSFLGVRMALMVLPAKLMSKEAIADASHGDRVANIEKKMDIVIKSEPYRSRVRDILLHAIDLNII